MVMFLQVFTDNACHRQVLSLDIYCRHREKGCTWSGPLSEHKVSSRDYNTKRAKLSIDVCAMFAASKAILVTSPLRAQSSVEFDF